MTNKSEIKLWLNMTNLKFTKPHLRDRRKIQTWIIRTVMLWTIATTDLINMHQIKVDINICWCGTNVHPISPGLLPPLYPLDLKCVELSLYLTAYKGTTTCFQIRCIMEVPWSEFNFERHSCHNLDLWMADLYSWDFFSSYFEIWYHTTRTTNGLK